jgi:hypothetical protein
MLGMFEIEINFLQKSYPVIKGKDKVVPLITKHHTMKTYWGSGGIAPRILDLVTSWM